MKSSLLLVGLLVACSTTPTPESRLSPLPAGDATVANQTADAFGQPFPGLSRQNERAFFRGRALFRDVWVTAPASADSRDGLGPLFNARACEPCHQKDGRGGPPERAGDPLRTMLLRLSVPGESEVGGPLADPVYGGQLQPLSTANVPAEGEARVDYAIESAPFADGDEYVLRVPRYYIDQPGYGPLSDKTLVSPRAAPAMIGLGLLAAIPEETLMAAVDPSDLNGDGISGRDNRVWDPMAGQKVLGRFGWKANQPSLRQQVAGAFLGDIGMTSSLFGQNDCTAVQVDCGEQVTGGEPELFDSILDDVTFYSGTLAVPARRLAEPEVLLRGEELFFASGCAGCHTAEFQIPAIAEFDLGPQTIQPFTDLLLHDMGEGLADGRPDFLANGREWRTPPLWGLGLIETVNGHLRLMHDGRADGVAEAILWHGGEGDAAAESFRQMTRSEREALVKFVLSL